MTDHDAMLAAVAAAPDEDTPRLVYADWLDDHADTVPCPACKGRGHDDTPWPMSNGCDTCRGSGSVSDGRRERAEFVRVQVEIARMRSCCPICNPETGHRRGCANGDDGDELRRRERELFDRHKSVWFGGDRWAVLLLPDDDPDLMPDLTTAIVRRGFVDEVRLPLAALVGGPGRTDYPTPNVPGLAAALGRVVGLTRVTIVGAEPHELPFSPSWNWFDDDSGRVVYPDAIPGELFDLLPGHPVPLSRSPRSHKSFPTRAAALDALAAAAMAFCKQVAHQPAASTGDPR